MEEEPGEDELPTDAEREADSSARRSNMLILLVAGGFFVVGGLNLAAYWLDSRHHFPMRALHCLYISIPLLIGVAILLARRALVNAIEEYLDE